MHLAKTASALKPGSKLPDLNHEVGRRSHEPIAPPPPDDYLGSVYAELIQDGIA
jgi:hypothetical protein